MTYEAFMSWETMVFSNIFFPSITKQMLIRFRVIGRFVPPFDISSRSSSGAPSIFCVFGIFTWSWLLVFPTSTNWYFYRHFFTSEIIYKVIVPDVPNPPSLLEATLKTIRKTSRAPDCNFSSVIQPQFKRSSPCLIKTVSSALSTAFSRAKYA